MEAKTSVQDAIKYPRNSKVTPLESQKVNLENSNYG